MAVLDKLQGLERYMHKNYYGIGTCQKTLQEIGEDLQYYRRAVLLFFITSDKFYGKYFYTRKFIIRQVTEFSDRKIDID